MSPPPTALTGALRAWPRCPLGDLISSHEKATGRFPCQWPPFLNNPVPCYQHIVRRRRRLSPPHQPFREFLLRCTASPGERKNWNALPLRRPSSAACVGSIQISVSLSREPPWDAESAVLDQDGAELGLWSIGACHGYDAVPVALLNLDYLNGYGFGCDQRADELRPTRDLGRTERECSAMEAWP